MRDAVPALCVVALVVVSGCSGLSGSGPTAETTTATTESSTATESATTTAQESTPGTTAAAGPADPDNDTIGWELGYWHDEAIAVDESDGLNDTELRAAKRRAMARIEYVRGLEFEENVTLEIITREELNRRQPFAFRENAWRDQYWEAAFVVPEDRSTEDAFTELYEVVVDGYFFRNQIVMVRENPESPRIDTSTLAHELAHAIDSQALAWEADLDTRDDEIAWRGVVEGDANYVEALYMDRCGEEWSCLAVPEADASDRPMPDINEGLYVSFATAYTVGPDFVRTVRERGDWAAVDRLFQDPPTTSEQVIHPDRFPADEPETVSVADRSTASWSRVSRPGRESSTGTFGESTLYVALWHNDVIPAPEARFNTGQHTGLNYSHPATTGWDGDQFVPYSNGSASGYVFESTWDSTADAREFRAAYLRLLDAHDATEVRDGVYRLPDDDPFGDAFRVVRRGRTVTVVNAPTVDALDAVHAPRESDD